MGNVKLKGSLGCSDYEMVQFRIPRAVKREHSKLTTLDFRRAKFGLLRDLIPWDTLHLEEYHRTKTWREEGPKKAG